MKNILRVYLNRFRRATLHIPRRCQLCWRLPNYWTQKEEQCIQCYSCFSSTCMYCFTQSVEQLQHNPQLLQCGRCKKPYWPTLFVDGVEQPTVVTVCQILRRRLANILLRGSTSLDQSGEGQCFLCEQRGLQICNICSLLMCRQCFLQNTGTGCNFDRCPGCRTSLSFRDVFYRLGLVSAEALASSTLLLRIIEAYQETLYGIWLQPLRPPAL